MTYRILTTMQRERLKQEMDYIEAQGRRWRWFFILAILGCLIGMVVAHYQP